MADQDAVIGAHRALVMESDLGAEQPVVLFLHGGPADGMGRPPRWNLAALRMVPFARAVRRACAECPVAIGTVRYRHRGWNGDRADATRDARHAVEQVARRSGTAPVVLVGHSMGARAALAVGGHPRVRAVIALAPWCPDDEPVEHLAGTPTVLIHSDRDRITAPEESRRFAGRARASGTPVCRLVVAGSEHTMLRRAADWHTATAQLVAGFLGAAGLPPAVAAALELRPAETGGLDIPIPLGGRLH